MEPFKKVIAPVAINALSEALTCIYWYKGELRSFLTHTLSDNSILARLDWSDYKRNIVSALMTFLTKHEGTYKNDLLRLMTEVCKMNDFSHLERLEDGKAKAKAAKQSVEALRKQISGHQDIVEEIKRQEERRQASFEKTMQFKDVQKKLEEIKSDFFQLVSSCDAQARGYKLEKIIKELFALFD